MTCQASFALRVRLGYIVAQTIQNEKLQKRNILYKIEANGSFLIEKNNQPLMDRFHELCLGMC
jgi:hypothetical protein